MLGFARWQKEVSPCRDPARPRRGRQKIGDAFLTSEVLAEPLRSLTKYVRHCQLDKTCLSRNRAGSARAARPSFGSRRSGPSARTATFRERVLWPNINLTGRGGR